MQAEGVLLEKVAVERQADMRYVGQSYELTVSIRPAADGAVAAAVAAFHKTHEAHYGHCDPSADVEFVNLRTVHTFRLEAMPVSRCDQQRKPNNDACAFRPVYFDSIGEFTRVPVHDRATIAVGEVIAGPAIIEQADTTVVVYPGQRAHTRPDRTIVLEAATHAQ